MLSADMACGVIGWTDCTHRDGSLCCGDIPTAAAEIHSATIARVRDRWDEASR
eukprot:COSAG02_NODE_42094_length_388_cov_0.539792_1_plen_52_part_10